MRDTRDDTNGDGSAYRREYLRAAGVTGLLGTVGLSGCLGDGGSGTGTLATRVKDAPGDIDDFESCVVTVEGIWLKPADGTDEETATAETTTEATVDTAATDDGVVEQDEDDVDEDAGREYHEFDEPHEADLVQLQDGNSALLEERAVEAGDYEFLQLDVSGVDARLADGGDAEVDTPGNAPLQFKQAFEVRDGERTVFVADFTPVQRGRTGRYLLQPVATGTEVRYEDVPTES